MNRNVDTCEVCGLIAETYQHPCQFAKGCRCWRGEICAPGKVATVKRATLFDGVVDTFQTEAELNGFRASQGMLL